MDKSRYYNPPDGTYVFHQDGWVEYYEPKKGSTISLIDVAFVIVVLVILLALYVF